jgi:hypothetical protein
MTGEPGREVHVRNGAVPDEVLAAAFGELGVAGAVIEAIPGEGREIEVHAPVSLLLANLAHTNNASIADTFMRFNETLWAHIRDPAVRLLLVDADTDITAILAPDLPDAAYAALASLRLATIEKFGIVAYDAGRNTWAQVDKRR